MRVSAWYMSFENVRFDRGEHFALDHQLARRSYDRRWYVRGRHVPIRVLFVIDSVKARLLLLSVSMRLFG
jgi:hypothetical protein